MKGLAVVSGGMDSVTMAHWLKKDQGHDITIASFHYGQRHEKELAYAAQCAVELGVHWEMIRLPIKLLLKGSALTDSLHVEVPHGHYEEESMKQTVVPNRNMIMLSVATGYAVSQELDFVAAAMHAGDHAIYPDCRPEFAHAMDMAIKLATEGFANSGFHLFTPFINMSKAQIVSLGDFVSVPWTQTWSCYEGRALHCGKCGTCVERREAFSLAGVVDPTSYNIRGVDRAV